MKAHALRRPAGFTLIEVIVAFALLALALTLLLGSLSGAARQVGSADKASRATLHAESLLAQLGVVEPLRPGRQQGEFEDGRYTWTLDVSPYVDPERPGQAMAAGGAPLLRIELTTRWGPGAAEALTWHSLRLGTPGADGGGGRP